MHVMFSSLSYWERHGIDRGYCVHTFRLESRLYYNYKVTRNYSRNDDVFRNQFFLLDINCMIINTISHGKKKMDVKSVSLG